MKNVFLFLISLNFLACGSSKTSFHKFDNFIGKTEDDSQTTDELINSEDAKAEIPASDDDSLTETENEVQTGNTDENPGDLGVEIEVLESDLSDEEVDAMVENAGQNMDDNADDSDGEGDDENADASNDEGDGENVDNGEQEKQEDSVSKALDQGEYHAVLWPPNHKMVLMKVVSLEKNGYKACSIKEITSSQSIGKDKYDYDIIDSETFVLRAEREGSNKEGRIYSLSLECHDEAQNLVSLESNIWVPHNKSQFK